MEYFAHLIHHRYALSHRKLAVFFKFVRARTAHSDLQRPIIGHFERPSQRPLTDFFRDASGRCRRSSSHLQRLTRARAETQGISFDIAMLWRPNGGEWQLGRVRVFTTTPTADRTTRSPRAVGGGELRCPPACSCTVEAILYFKLANEIAASWAEVGEKDAIYKGRVRFPFRAAAAS